jgi:hypothetical protein
VASNKITVKRHDAKNIRQWTICLNGQNIGHIIVHPDGDWTGRVGTMSEEHFNSALELVTGELAEEELLMSN